MPLPNQQPQSSSSFLERPKYKLLSHNSTSHIMQNKNVAYPRSNIYMQIYSTLPLQDTHFLNSFTYYLPTFTHYLLVFVDLPQGMVSFILSGLSSVYLRVAQVGLYDFRNQVSLICFPKNLSRKRLVSIRLYNG